MEEIKTKQNPLILIVDDNPNNLQVLANILNTNNYRLAIANNGLKAINSAIKLKPDLILLDIMMPEMDGYEVISILKKDPVTESIPVIFLTAKTESEDIVKGFKLGSVDYITKPFNHDELIVRIKNHLFIKFAQDTINQKNIELENANQIIENESIKIREINEKLMFSESELKEANKSKDKFFSIISHDLRGPLGGVMSLIELIKTYHDTMTLEEILNIVDSIDQASRKTFDLLDNLLQWSRLHTGRMDFYPSEVYLNDIVDRNISLLTYNASQKNISLESFLTAKKIVYCDSNMLDLIIRNLVSNAIKFTKENGSIKISSKDILNKNDEAEFVEICVEDSGIGMDDETLNKLFRIDINHTSVGTNNEQGTGLGLILVHDFVKKHGGNIRVESEIEKGSKFIFSLPLKEFDIEYNQKFLDNLESKGWNSI